MKVNGKQINNITKRSTRTNGKALPEMTPVDMSRKLVVGCQVMDREILDALNATIYDVSFGDRAILRASHDAPDEVRLAAAGAIAVVDASSIALQVSSLEESREWIRELLLVLVMYKVRVMLPRWRRKPAAGEDEAEETEGKPEEMKAAVN